MRACCICGAGIKNRNAQTTTCDPICTRAKQNGVTRQIQIEREMAEPFPERDGRGCPTCGCRFCICAEM